jgi:retron-type reverse transcriptase
MIKKQIQTNKITIDDFLVILNTNLEDEELNISFQTIKKRELSYFAFHAANRYHSFIITQKNKKERLIKSPALRLKDIQQRINSYLQSCFLPHHNSHGFLPSKSIVTNARPHINKSHILNMDLKDFFPSVEFRRVKIVLELSPFNFTDELAFLVANLCCDEGVLPQGAPTSPILSNIVCQRLDRKLNKLAKQNRIKCTRYADDITFSSNRNIFTPFFIQKVVSIIETENFRVNDSKTRILNKGQRQEVTGIIVNQKLNIKREYIKEVRQILHNCKSKGIEKAMYLYQENGGENCSERNFFLMLKGRIEHIGLVRGKEDGIYRKFLDKLIKIKPSMNTKKIQIEEFIIDILKHNPNETTFFLEKFKRSEGLKFLTHDFDKSGELFERENILKIANEEFEIFAPREKNIIKSSLRSRVNDFAFNKKSEKWFFDKEEYSLNWYSKQVIEWCLSNPYHHPINNETFYKAMFLPFKNSIEVRSPQLEGLIKTKLIEKLGKYFSEFFITYENLDKANFYTDVDAFLSGLGSLFSSIKQRCIEGSEKRELKISFSRKTDETGRKRIIRIIHVGSETNKSLKDKRELFGGDFYAAEQSFFQICDWSIISKNADKEVNKINILFNSKYHKTHEKINEKEIEGFTHELTFYS